MSVFDHIKHLVMGSESSDSTTSSSSESTTTGLRDSKYSKVSQDPVYGPVNNLINRNWKLYYSIFELINWHYQYNYLFRYVGLLFMMIGPAYYLYLPVAGFMSLFLLIMFPLYTMFPYLVPPEITSWLRTWVLFLRYVASVGNLTPQGMVFTWWNDMELFIYNTIFAFYGWYSFNFLYPVIWGSAVYDIASCFFFYFWPRILAILKAF